MPEQRPRRFVSLTRTVNPDGTHTLDAIDQFGRAWWLVVGNDEAPASWTELQPLPGPREAGHE
jgi:hypothetical protein